MTTGDVVFVAWRDAYCDHGWIPVEEVVQSFTEFGGNRVVTVGFLVGETDEWIGIVHSMTEDGSVNGPIVIPKGWIDERRVLAGTGSVIDVG